MKKKNDYYTYLIIWSVEDGEYVGLCPEFLSLSWLASTPEEALKGIRTMVAGIIKDMKKNKKVIPEPFFKFFTGKGIQDYKRD